MKTSVFILCLISCLILAACTRSARSISNPSYHEPGTTGYRPNIPTHNSSDAAFQYRGELSEFDVLGITRGEITTETEISRALDHAKRIKLHPSSSILLIQSGALIPDSPMISELEKHFRVSTFTGVPPSRGTSQTYDHE